MPFARLCLVELNWLREKDNRTSLVLLEPRSIRLCAHAGETAVKADKEKIGYDRVQEIEDC
jgi:hypothetical protein